MNVNRFIVCAFALSIGIPTIFFCLKNNTERENSMNEFLEKKEHFQTSQSFFDRDKQNNSIKLEWIQTGLLEKDFATAMIDAWEIARSAYTPVEINFLKAFPHVVGTDPYFKQFEPLFQQGIEHVDWPQAELIMQNILKKHFIFDASQFSETIKQQFAQDACYVVTISDTTIKQQLGFITFLKRASYAPGDIKVMSLAVDPAAQNRGLGKLLMSSIFKIHHDIQRIFLCTRVTNEPAINAYQAWGFTKDLNPVLDHAFNMNHWVFFEYKVHEKQVLQQTAHHVTRS